MRKRSHEDYGPLVNGLQLDNLMNVDSDSLTDDQKNLLVAGSGSQARLDK